MAPSDPLPGLHEALAILAEEEAKWAAKLAQPSPRATREARRIRWQAFRTAQQRIRTVINRREKAGRKRLDSFLRSLDGVAGPI